MPRNSPEFARLRDRAVEPTRAAVAAATAAAIVAGFGSLVVLAADGDTDAVHAAVLLWMALSYAAAGLVAWWRRPANRIGPLMIITGFSTFAAALTWADNTAVHTVGEAFDLVPPVLVLHVFLAYPVGLLRGRPERLLVATGYTAAVGGQLAVMMLGGLGPGLRIVHEPDAATLLHNVELIVIAGVSLTGVALLAVRRRAGGRPLRRSLSLLVDSFALGLVMIGALLLVGVFAGRAFPMVQHVSIAVISLAPTAFLAGLLSARLARSAVADLVVELRTEPTDLRAPLARALRDPSLSLVYWLPQFGSWADQEGKPVELPTGGRRMATLIESAGDAGETGEPVAALVHDPALNDERELLDAVTAAAAIALENGRLHAELRANVDELRGSRARVIEAGQKERQRLERDLHDGAQQRLIALSLDLGMLQARLDGDAAARALLAQAKKEIAASLGELRDVARGLHPAVLSAHGLAVALESLAARAPVPVRLTVGLDGRVAEAVEVAAYYVVCESLANIGKHAQATAATVSVTRDGSQIVIEVVDDGLGGADTEGGSGLRGLADRVEALDGRLRVWTPRGGGTRVRAELPCA
ncbi:histidine kinase [Streptomyces sp. HC44]|uniref:histidine kinase n=1 Tax=Streptomyces scabichelini TaxID=2711217 RepID=A0A6G4VLJ5_9ACTN|nr:histidine kinase [Streptomyces scabichelini]NGO14725.1 histidine kinase [Streptomyces scabichelini]